MAFESIQLAFLGRQLYLGGFTMIGLDTNCQKLLVLLLQENQPLPANKLARKLQITPRMARYRLNKVEIWLHLNSLTLIKQPGVGYLIDARPETRRSLLPPAREDGR